MSIFALERTGFVFVSLALPIVVWAVLDTRGFFRFLSFGRKTELARWQMQVVRIPGAIVIVGIIWLILVTVISQR